MSAQARRRTGTVRKSILGSLGVLALLALWQTASALHWINPIQVPSAAVTLETFVAQMQDREFWRNVGRTLTTWAVGLGIAIGLGCVLGAIVGLVPRLRRATHTTVEFLRPIPSVALIPLAILIFGIQPQAALVVIVYASFWLVFIHVLYGVVDVDAVARDTARSFSLTGSSRLRNLVLPSVAPYLVTGVRLAAAVALILAITAEMTIGNPGLGRALTYAAGIGDIATVFAIVVTAGVLGLVVNIAFRLVERRALHWHQSIRGEETP